MSFLCPCPSNSRVLNAGWGAYQMLATVGALLMHAEVFGFIPLITCCILDTYIAWCCWWVHVGSSFFYDTGCRSTEHIKVENCEACAEVDNKKLRDGFVENSKMTTETRRTNTESSIHLYCLMFQLCVSLLTSVILRAAVRCDCHLPLHMISNNDTLLHTMRCRTRTSVVVVVEAFR